MSGDTRAPERVREQKQRLADLRGALAEVPRQEAEALRRRLGGVERRLKRGQPVGEKALAAIEADLGRARADRAARVEAEPRLDYPPDLPVTAHREVIRDAIRDNQVVVVAGETGSGKTTQLPKLCLELGYGIDGRVGHTQPRRIAARSVANRLAEEVGGETGELVGYKVRFSDRVGQGSRVKVMTDGILLAEIPHDPDLLAYDVIIIDEAHERSLNIDFLLGYLKRLLPRRPDLRLVITSATIDTERFSNHFDGAPVVEVSGRGYPVEVRYRPPEEAEDGEGGTLDGVLAAVDELAAEGPGDILVFFPTERDIREAAEALRKHHPPQTTILPLYSRQSAAEQNRVFRTGGGRRIVLATNVAETSLTVPGIRYVVDTGLVRMSRYSVRSRVQRLPVEPVSQASADQRAGRCGRVAPGICIRLFSQADYQGRPPFTDPEIRRTNLASVVLRMADLGLGDVAEFPFVDPPERKQINDAYRLLHELRAVDDGRRITDAGRELARLPVDPRLGRILQAARGEGALAEALVVVAGLTIQDPRERPAEAAGEADARHAPFADDASDFASLLRLWDHVEDRRRHLTRRRFEAHCKENFLSPVRVREWRELHTQLKQTVTEQGWRLNEAPAEYNGLHRALLAGLLTHVAVRDEKKEYLGTRGRKLHLFPGSGIKGAPKWIIAAELAETSRLFARTVARIEPEWIEPLADHLVSRSYGDPHWERKSARVVAAEQTSLQGLILASNRRVDYGRIDPEEARRVFIQQALVEGDYATDAAFYAHNRDCLEAVAQLEDKARRRDLLVDEATLFDFYDRRIPEGIHTGKAFERWRKQVEADDPRHLFLDPEAALAGEAGDVTAADYPDRLTVAGVELPLRYRFEPGHAEDGVTATVPLAALNQLPPATFEWLVPGLLEEKITALIRGLPKARRRHFVPAPDFARAAREAVGTRGDEPLTEALGRALLRMTGMEVAADEWAAVELPDHLRLRFEVVDADGTVVATGRDLAALQSEQGGAATAGFTGVAGDEWERDGITDWDFGELPERVELTTGGVTFAGHPGLVDQGEAVGLRLFDTAEAAEVASRAGLRRLYRLAAGQTVRYLRRQLPGLEAVRKELLRVDRSSDAAEVITDVAVDRVFLGDEPLPRDEATFRERLERRGDLVPTATRLVEQLHGILGQYRDITRALEGFNSLALMESLADIREQLDFLVYPGFLGELPPERLADLPRYLRGIQRRVERLEQDPVRERAPLRAIRPWWERWRDHPRRDELTDFRWLLEEYRIALFAQEIGARGKVSEKRVAAAWKEVSR